MADREEIARLAVDSEFVGVCKERRRRMVLLMLAFADQERAGDRERLTEIGRVALEGFPEWPGIVAQDAESLKTKVSLVLHRLRRIAAIAKGAETVTPPIPRPGDTHAAHSFVEGGVVAYGTSVSDAAQRAHADGHGVSFVREVGAEPVGAGGTDQGWPTSDEGWRALGWHIDGVGTSTHKSTLLTPQVVVWCGGGDGCWRWQLTTGRTRKEPSKRHALIAASMAIGRPIAACPARDGRGGAVTDVYYCGCWLDSGHELYDRDGLRARFDGARKWRLALDGGVFMPAPRTQGVYRITAVSSTTPNCAWTVLSWWDNSVDGRPGSHSTFLARGVWGHDEMFRKARAAFPHVFARMKFELIPEDGHA